MLRRFSLRTSRKRRQNEEIIAKM